MNQYTIMAYNIEHMKTLFKGGHIAEEQRPRAEALAATIRAINPHILGVGEASSKLTHHQVFLEETGLKDLGLCAVKGTAPRGNHDLVFYYREPFEPVSLDEQVAFYDSWIEDIDDDGIKEVCEFERAPLEAVFRHRETGVPIMLILIAFKGKGVLSTIDFAGYQHLALANRKKQLAQAQQVRRRLDALLNEAASMPFMVLGDINDEPGMDFFERALGASAVETVMGSVYKPEHILHNALWHLTDGRAKSEIWTTEYPDRIVANTGNHRGWLDHILVSPDMRHENSSVRLVPESGAIGSVLKDFRLASDHLPVYCRIEM